VHLEARVVPTLRQQRAMSSSVQVRCGLRHWRWLGNWSVVTNALRAVLRPRRFIP